MCSDSRSFSTTDIGRLEKALPFAVVLALQFYVCIAPCSAQNAATAGIQQQLAFASTPNGDRIPDYSFAGFAAGSESPPMVAAMLRLSPSGGDDTQRIQDAIDQIAKMPANEKGLRGSLQLSPETFLVSGTIRLQASGCVLRGSVRGDSRTIIRAIGTSRRPLICIGTQNPIRTNPVAARVAGYVPVGSRQIAVTDIDSFHVGQTIQIEHVSSKEWIQSLGMNQFPNDDGKGSWLDWRPGSLNWIATRVVTEMNSNQITLDCPLTCAIDPEVATANLYKVNPSECQFIGVENLSLVSEARTDINAKDEDHAWDAIRFLGVTDAWARSIHCSQFAGSAVHIGRESRRISVIDCESDSPVSEDANWRRNTFHTLGEQSLFLRCKSNDGRHDFSVGHLASGPNAFVDCKALRANSWSGPHGSWATGVLYDNVEIEGNGLALTNLETEKQGVGWATANSLLWNCVAPVVTCRKPPGAHNWAIGIWGEVIGNGQWRNLNEYADTRSVYHALLIERIGKSTADKAMNETSVYPSWEDLHIPRSDKVGISVTQTTKSPTVNHDRKLTIRNGWLTMGDELATGKRMRLSWWRGSVVPSKVAEFGPGLTRFVPGMDGVGYTDSIEEVATGMQSQGQIAIEHHWGLWYDRRRDDHQMLRRMNADVWAPFYELPWARSGQGVAWDGLSRYDLSRFNPWYFDRLESFASQADQRGLILMQYMYFQHNILEAGAHWADFPWRPANCIQETGFPEPPTYVNRKRIFMADAFYDVSHPMRRQLHMSYIRHCLDVLGKHDNVLFFLGEEFTGPTHFVKFWLETVHAWELQNHRDVKVVLSVTRDVQDLIMSDSQYADIVDVIDVKYWWRNNDGSLYDPKGGENLAPRQQLREWKGPKSHNQESLSRSVHEMRSKFPNKAVLCSVPGADPWQNLLAGASLSELPVSMDPGLKRDIASSKPSSEWNDWKLESENRLPVLQQTRSDQISQSHRIIQRLTGDSHPSTNKDSSSNSTSQKSIVWFQKR